MQPFSSCSSHFLLNLTYFHLILTHFSLNHLILPLIYLIFHPNSLILIEFLLILGHLLDNSVHFRQINTFYG